MVIIDIETYEKLLDTTQIDTAITEAEEEFAAEGVLLDAREALANLRMKHFG